MGRRGRGPGGAGVRGEAADCGSLSYGRIDLAGSRPFSPHAPSPGIYRSCPLPSQASDACLVGVLCTPLQARMIVCRLDGRTAIAL